MQPTDPNESVSHSEDEIRLSDPQGIPEAQRIVRSRISPAIVEPKSQPRRGQFTIASVMLLLFFLCVGLSGSSWIPAPVFAGIVGATLLLVIFSATTSPADTALSYTVWIGIILAYAAACLVALLRLSE